MFAGTTPVNNATDKGLHMCGARPHARCSLGQEETAEETAEEVANAAVAPPENRAMKRSSR